MEILYWHWIVFGVGLILLELVIPSFTALWFGLGAVVVGLALVLSPLLSLTAQIAIWATVSAVLTTLWFKVLKPSSRHSEHAAQQDVAGVIGLVITKPSDNRNGKIRFSTPLLGMDEWDFKTSDAVEIGDQVQVENVSNGVLQGVKK